MSTSKTAGRPSDGEADRPADRRAAGTDVGLIEALAGVFRAYGYEGTTMARLMKATSLNKSSLYHRFPEGKEQMAEAALEAMNARLVEDVLAPLKGGGSAADRVAATAERISELYDHGHRSCLLDTISIGPRAGGRIAGGVLDAYRTLLGAFIGVAKEAGLDEPAAAERAREAIVAIEGGLVVSRIAGDPAVFRAAVRSLPAVLTSPR